MEERANFYSIPRHLDQGHVIMGLPADEVLPALVVFGAFAMANYIVTGMIIAAVIGIGLRTIKQSHGENFLPLIVYWFSPASLTKSLFKHTPPSCYKYWLN